MSTSTSASTSTVAATSATVMDQQGKSRSRITIPAVIVTRILGVVIVLVAFMMLIYIGIDNDVDVDVNDIVDVNAIVYATGGWELRFRHWRGYLQREGLYVPATTSTFTPSSTSSAGTGVLQKPLLFLLHGFGGSLDQFTAVAAPLSQKFEVIALVSHLLVSIILHCYCNESNYFRLHTYSLWWLLTTSIFDCFDGLTSLLPPHSFTA
jgi:hypothetical protein